MDRVTISDCAWSISLWDYFASLGLEGLSDSPRAKLHIPASLRRADSVALQVSEGFLRRRVLLLEQTGSELWATIQMTPACDECDSN
jgi:hypothetical protein